MSQTSTAENESPRRSRTRRRETMLNAVATILGCLALVIMIATVVRVVMVKLWESAKVNPEYIQSVYDSTHERQLRQAAALRRSSEVTGGSFASQTAAFPNPATPHLEAKQSAASPAPTTPAATANGSGSLLHVSGSLAAGIQDIEDKRPRIESALRGFFESPTVESRQAYVRDAPRVRPLMESYHRLVPLRPRGWKSLGWLLPVEEVGFRLGYAEANFADGESMSVIIEEVADGSFRVDWESAVRYSEQDWNEFQQSRPTAPVLFRVIASRALHAPLTGAPHGSEILEIRHPDDDTVVYGYFDRQDPKFQPLLQQLQTGNWKDVPLTLRLCYTVPSEGAKSVRIANVEGKGWLILQGTRS